jgi:4-hydroxybenzoate polyprenyltransferase
MDALVARLSPILHLTRVTTVFAAISNVWFVLLWSRASAHERGFAPSAVTEGPLWPVLAGGAIFAMGLFAFATALNDTIDARRDRALHPDKPLPSGRMSIETAVALVAGALLCAVLGATILGIPAVFMCLFTTFTILVHNSAARYVPQVGLVTLGLVYGAHMMTANAYLIFVWPVLVVMAHALLLGAVTHRLEGKRPKLTWPVLLTAAAGWLFWSGVLLYVGIMRADGLWPTWVHPQAAVVPALLAAAFALFAWNKARITTDTRRAADKIRRYGAFWVTLYGIGWMLGQGYTDEALLLVALSLAGLLGMTVLRETYGLIEHPIGYRR